MTHMVADEAQHGIVIDEQSLEDEYKWFQNARKKVELALQALERMAFTIGNLNFGIQGVCIAAIINNSISLCSVWFTCTISVLTALPNLTVLFLVGLSYRELVDFHASELRRGCVLEIPLIAKFPDRYCTGPVCDNYCYTSISPRAPLVGKK